jgi:uncharacterized protein (DUF1800 family)
MVLSQAVSEELIPDRQRDEGMSQSPGRVEAALVLSRFGLGARQGDIAQIGADPRGALKDEIAQRRVPLPVGDELAPSPALLRDFFAYADTRREERQRRATAAAAAPAEAAGGGGIAAPSRSGEAAPMQAPSPPAAPSAPAELPLPRRIFLAEAKARFCGTIHEPLIGFGERLAMFYANHFAVSAAKGPQLRMLAGAFEREAIRPHVFGRFADMLVAVETHPAMLFYLDNRVSVGPNSKAGQNRKRGLNENLAREILELHTLGVNGGYTQSDVTSLARMITGWSVAGPKGALGEPGSFIFVPNAHEPGQHELLGRRYAQGGFEQGRAALLDLTRHPATAAHLASKLARHFVADAPPASLVDKLTRRFRETDGDLAAVALALIEADEAWSPGLVKLRSPLEFMVAMLRATATRPEPQRVLGGLNLMGQPYWQPAGPNGFPDNLEAWASPEGMKMRMDIANAVAGRSAGAFEPMELAESRLGALLSDETRDAIAHAASRTQGLAIALMSPEFQRR